MRVLGRAFVTLAAIIALHVCSSGTNANTIAPPTLEDILEEAGFVGIVECEEAGGIVATFKVVESWFGAPVGTRFRIRLDVDAGSTAPYALCGEKYLMAPTALAPSERGKVASRYDKGPLGWREVPADYRINAWDCERVLLDKDRSLAGFGTDAATLEEFRKVVQKRIGTTPEEREVKLLRRYCDLEIGETEEEREDATPELAELRKKLQAGSGEEIVSALLANEREVVGEELLRILRHAGGPETLKKQEAISAKIYPGGEEELKRTLRCIRERLGQDVVKEPEEDDNEAIAPAPKMVPSPEELAWLRKVYEGNPPCVGRAFGALMVYDPEPVANAMLKWNGKSTDKNLSPRWGYEVGSAFGHYCVKDREQHLKALLNAKEPFIRVSAAVYLHFDDPVESTKKLKEFTKIKGDAGAWAALALARRGDKSAMPRLIEFFDAPRRGDLLGDPWYAEFGARIRELLSNSAKASGIDQPMGPVWGPEFETSAFDTKDGGKAYQKKVYQYYAGWWKKNGDKVRLYDPWLETLDKQRID